MDITIAAVCMAIFRSKYIEENTSAVEDRKHKETYSLTSITWLEHLDRQLPQDQSLGYTRQASNGGEVTTRGYHGCPKCTNENTKYHCNPCLTMKDLYLRTKYRYTEILNAKTDGTSTYKLVVMWECDWKRSNEFKTLSKVSSILGLVCPVDSRDPLYGGIPYLLKILRCNIHILTRCRET